MKLNNEKRRRLILGFFVSSSQAIDAVFVVDASVLGIIATFLTASQQTSCWPRWYGLKTINSAFLLISVILFYCVQNVCVCLFVLFRYLTLFCCCTGCVLWLFKCFHENTKKFQERIIINKDLLNEIILVAQICSLVFFLFEAKVHLINSLLVFLFISSSIKSDHADVLLHYCGASGRTVICTSS